MCCTRIFFGHFKNTCRHRNVLQSLMYQHVRMLGCANRLNLFRRRALPVKHDVSSFNFQSITLMFTSTKLFTYCNYGRQSNPNHDIQRIYPCCPLGC